MPKKFDGENSKVAVAKARKDAVKQAEKKKKEEKEEEEFWKDDDKNVQKKLQRKDEKEKKKAEQLVRVSLFFFCNQLPNIAHTNIIRQRKTPSKPLLMRKWSL